MKSGIKPSEESVCTGGGDSEAQPTGNCASYLVFPSLFFFSPIITSSVTLYAVSSHCSPITLLTPTPSPPPTPFFFTIYLHYVSLHTDCFLLLSSPPLHLSGTPGFSFTPLLLTPSLRLFPPRSIWRCHIWKLSDFRPGLDWEREGKSESEIIGLIPPSSQRLSRYSITP